MAKESKDDLKKGMNIVYALTVILITDYIPIVIGIIIRITFQIIPLIF